MRISDWSSDVCSSDLVVQALHRQRAILAPPTLAQGALMRAGQRPEAAVLQRRILEREPQAADAQRVGVEHGGTLVPADLAADKRIHEDVYVMREKGLRSAERREGKERVSQA